MRSQAAPGIHPHAAERDRRGLRRGRVGGIPGGTVWRSRAADRQCRQRQRRRLPWIVGAWALLGICPSLLPAQDPPPPTEPDKKDERLGERLIRQAATDAEEDLMAAIIRMMNEAARKLEIDFDPGESTQAVQQRVVDQLDKAIKAAAMQRRLRRSSDRPQSPDKRRMPGDKPDQDTGATSNQGEPGEPRSGMGGDPTDRRSTDGDLRDIRRTWGHLPMREREEIIQGVGEGYLERYRDWIERYYRALQEAED